MLHLLFCLQKQALHLVWTWREISHDSHFKNSLVTPLQVSPESSLVGVEVPSCPLSWSLLSVTTQLVSGYSFSVTLNDCFHQVHLHACLL